MYASILKKSEILEQLPDGRIVVLDTVHSTNQYIIDNLQYLESGDVFVSEHQTQGRGRGGKVWVSAVGKSICLSVYWKLYKNLPTIIELSLMISFVVTKVLTNLGIPNLQVKWPNDLYVNNKKLAGILIEIITKSKNIFHLIIGIGINISICTDAYTKLQFEVVKDWIDLKNIGVTLNCNILVASIVDVLRWQLKQFEDDKYKPFICYYQRIMDFLYGKSIVLFINDKIQYGIVLGIKSNGALLVMDNLGVIHHYLNNDVSVCVI